jgi:hypothetical protein
MNLPPRHLVEEAVLHTVLPPFAAAAVVLAVVLVVFGRKAAPIASVVGFVAAVVAAIWVDPIVPWTPNLTKRSEWVPALAAAGALAGLLGRSFATGWQTVLWAAVITLFVAKVCPAKYLKEPWWVIPTGAALMTAAGIVPAALVRRNPGAGVPFAVALCLFAASGVAIHAHAKQLMDLAVVGGAALAGLAVVSLFVRVDVGPALPGTAVILAGVLLGAFYDADDDCKVPKASYLIPLLTPLTLAVAYLPGINRLSGVKLRAVQLACVLAPLVYAVWAATAEKLDFENL